MKNKEKLEDKKLLLFTHTDLDGFSCYIVAQYHISYVENHMCDYSEIEEEMEKIIKQKRLSEFDLVILSDLSISFGFANMFKKECEANNVEFYIIDHHQRSIDNGLNKLENSRIRILRNSTELTCATELLHEFLQERDLLTSIPLESYIELVRLYDTWEWKKGKNNLPYKINSLYWLLSHERFYDSIMDKIRTPSVIRLNETEDLLLEVEEERIQRYVEEKIKDVYYRNIQNYNCAIVFAESNANNIAEELYKDTNVDIAIIIKDNSISYRTSKDIDVNTFAKAFGGGGHIKASGSIITKEQKEKYIKLIFSK